MKQNILLVFGILVFLTCKNLWASSEHDISYEEKVIVLKNSQSVEETFYFEPTKNENHPLQLVLKINKNDVDKISIIDHYGVAGGPPRVKAFFTYPVRGEENIFVLIGWFINSKGAGAYGDMYQIYAYKRNHLGDFIPNYKISVVDSNLSGMDGTLAGAPSRFTYQNEESIKSYIDKTYNNSSVATQVKNSLCLENQKVFFSCTTNKGKMLSLCGIQSDNDSVYSVFYRYGSPQHLELAYPAIVAGNNSLFTYAAYYRYQTEHTRIKFQNNGYLYTIYGDRDENISAKYTAGVTVTNLKTKKITDIQCSKIHEYGMDGAFEYLPLEENPSF